MITNLIMASLISAAGVSTNLVYNVKMENNRLTNKEVFSVEDGKYLKRLFKMDFTYNAQGQVTDKKTYVWSDARQNYILQQTPYLDIIKERYPDQFISSTGGKSRIDFVYCTRPLLEKVIQAEILRDDYTGNIVRDPQKLSNFYHPSDHRPILVDFDMGKKK